MRTSKWILCGTLPFITMTTFAQTPQQTAKPTPPDKATKLSLLPGRFEGLLKAGSVDLRIAVKLTKTATGWTGTLDSLDQGAFNIPLSAIKLTDGKLSFEVPTVSGSFEGTLGSDGNTIIGEWIQGGSLPLVLNRKDKADEAKRPQTPKAPFPYKTQDVTYANPKAPEVTLAATLNLPSGNGPFPCVVFITGSGAQDRDETIMGHKPFAVIADYLARRGIASLRADDRGTAKSTGNFLKATSLDFKSDAQAGVGFLKTRKEIDPQRIGLIGHSEGGLIAPMVAVEMPDQIAAIVMLAGTGVNGKAILIEQQKLILKAMGAPEIVANQAGETQTELFGVLDKEPDNDMAQIAMLKLLTEKMEKQPGYTKEMANQQRPMLESQTKMYISAWFRYFLKYDPIPTLKKVKCPVLALNGSKDLQVPPYQNLPVIEKSLRDGGNTKVTVKELPNLNHLFQNAKTGGVQEYAMIEETFDVNALSLLGDWLVLKLSSSVK